MREGRIRANGIEFAYLEEGKGPLLLCLHGFPDNAWSWEHQMPAFAAAGYRVVAPFLRGYAPTEVPGNGYYDRATLALDVRGLIRALGDAPAVIVSQDWGAAITYGVLAAFPESISKAVVMAIPHPIMIRKSMRSPGQLVRAFHWWLFQLPRIPEFVSAARHYAFIEFLWRYWAPGYEDPAHMERIKRTLASPGSLSAAINYYRAALNSSKQDPALNTLRERLDDPIKVPTLALCGGEDIRRFPMRQQAWLFGGPYEYQETEGCGHFLHRERPEAVTRAVLKWLGPA
jgi:pimeloyl-ACP methyl ester carboxylesterase